VTGKTRKPSWRKRKRATAMLLYKGTWQRNLQQINDMRFPM